MTSSSPADAMERFLARLAPHDTAAADTVLTVRMDDREFRLSARAARALSEALHRYVDPNDHGTCGRCGRALTADLYCDGCGHVDGIFGQALAHHVERVRRREP